MSANEDLPGLPPWSNDLLKLTQQVSEEMRWSVVPLPPAVIANAAEAIKHYNRAVTPGLQKALRQFHATARSVEWITQEWLREFSPDNWHDLDARELDVIDLVQESGIPVVWAPRAEIVDALIAFERDERYSVLARSGDDVLTDLSAVLDRARGANVRGHADASALAGEAIAAATRCRPGRARAS
jgi:hypothetical protein